MKRYFDCQDHHGDIRKISKKRPAYSKRRPANEITEEDVLTVLQVIKNYNGYPKLREISKLVAMEPFKLNVVIRYLEKSGAIIIDGDGYIVWTRTGSPEQLTLGDVAELSSEVRELLDKTEE